MKKFLLVLFFALSVFQLIAQISGCTDPQSNNYNALATQNDGSCAYPFTSVTPVSSMAMSQNVNESSGLILMYGKLLTHNDNTDLNLYSLDTITGVSAIEYSFPTLTNQDWEEIAQDQDYVYIGDFGNNVSGNRTNLRINRIDKASMLAQQHVCETISFSYGNQTSFTPVAANTTDFDCEAFIVSTNYIYLFTKQWTTKSTTVYKIPKTPGNHIAVPMTTFNVQGMITAASFMESQNLVTLAGYNEMLQPFMYLLYDFIGDDFFSGNKRKLHLPLPFHQIEGIATNDGQKYFLTNERFIQGSFVNIPAKVHTISLAPFLSSHFALTTLDAANQNSDQNSFIAFYDSARQTILIRNKNSADNYALFDNSGRMVLNGVLSAGENAIDVGVVSRGIYHLKVGHFGSDAFTIALID